MNAVMDGFALQWQKLRNKFVSQSNSLGALENEREIVSHKCTAKSYICKSRWKKSEPQNLELETNWNWNRNRIWKETWKNEL